MQFYLEHGVNPATRTLLENCNTKEQALEYARATYPQEEIPDSEMNWVVWAQEEDDLILCPGGPDCEEFTWVPRSSL